jgi:hypothetical protein
MALPSGASTTHAPPFGLFERHPAQCNSTYGHCRNVSIDCQPNRAAVEFYVHDSIYRYGHQNDYAANKGSSSNQVQLSQDRIVHISVGPISANSSKRMQKDASEVDERNDREAEKAQ